MLHEPLREKANGLGQKWSKLDSLTDTSYLGFQTLVPDSRCLVLMFLRLAAICSSQRFLQLLAVLVTVTHAFEHHRLVPIQLCCLHVGGDQVPTLQADLSVLP